MDTNFRLVDVFGERPFSGNPLAVVLGATDASTEGMQEMTRWLNFSETAFVLPAIDPAADYRVRIFTLHRVMPFAGHPTLGSCHAWLASAGRPRRSDEIVQECGVGLVNIRRSNNNLAFRAPPLIRSGAVDQTKRMELAVFLGIPDSEILDATWADNGPGWVVVMLRSAERVLKLRPAATYPTRLDVGVVGAYADNASPAFELRAFFTDHNGAVREDPVTGSLNASVGQWLFATGRANRPYVASQGECLGRRGRIYVSRDHEGHVWVGGATSDMFTGRLAVGDAQGKSLG